MQGIFYFLSIVAISIVIYWLARNDRLPKDEPTKGLLAFKDGDVAKPSGGGNDKRARRTGRGSGT